MRTKVTNGGFELSSPGFIGTSFRKAFSHLLKLTWLLIGLLSASSLYADWNSDGKTDFAIWRPSSGQWIINQSGSGSIVVKQWGAQGDTPIAGDFDGDGVMDFALWRPSTGQWIISLSSTGGTLVKQWGSRATFRSPPTLMATARPISPSGVPPRASGLLA